MRALARQDPSVEEWQAWKQAQRRDVGKWITELPLESPEGLAELPAKTLIEHLRHVPNRYGDQLGQEVVDRLLDAIGKRPAEEKRSALTWALKHLDSELLLHGRWLKASINEWESKKILAEKGLTKHTWTYGVYESDTYEIERLAQDARIRNGDTIVDIGSGFGTPGLLLAAKFPKSKITGFEIVPLKNEHAKARAEFWGLTNVEFVEQDLSKRGFELPDADVYYMYSPVNPTVARKLLKNLKEIAKRRKFKLIVNLQFSIDSEIDLSKQEWLKPMDGYEGDEAGVYVVK